MNMIDKKETLFFAVEGTVYVAGAWCGAWVMGRTNSVFSDYFAAALFSLSVRVTYAVFGTQLFDRVLEISNGNEGHAWTAASSASIVPSLILLNSCGYNVGISDVIALLFELVIVIPVVWVAAPLAHRSVSKLAF